MGYAPAQPDDVEFRVIANDSTRVAALLSGETDMIYTVPPQDTQRLSSAPNIRIHQKAELRTIFLGFYELRDQLLKSDVQGKNPFRDVRVRRAFYQALGHERDPQPRHAQPKPQQRADVRAGHQRLRRGTGPASAL